MKLGGFNTANLIGGGALFVIGVIAIAESSTYPIGQLNHMGPGYLPLVLGLLIVALATGIIFQGRRTDAKILKIKPRAIMALSAAILGFAFANAHLGIVPATFVVVVLSSLADERFKMLTAVLTASILSAFAYLVFIKWLGVPMDAFLWD
jgi:hypothetical protein